MDKNTIKKIYGAIVPEVLAQSAWELEGAGLIDAARRKDRGAIEDALRRIVEYMASSLREGRLTAAEKPYSEHEEQFREGILGTLISNAMQVVYGDAPGDVVENTLWSLVSRVANMFVG